MWEFMFVENDMNGELSMVWLMNWWYVEWVMHDGLNYYIYWLIDEMNYIDDGGWI